MLVRYKLNYKKQDSKGLGLWWEPGQVRNVTPEAAERLLQYTDTWEKVQEAPTDDGKALLSEEIGLVKPEKRVEEPLPVIHFHAMDKKALIEFAETKYNQRLDKRQTEDTIRHRVIALFGKHEMDNG